MLLPTHLQIGNNSVTIKYSKFDIDDLKKSSFYDDIPKKNTNETIPDTNPIEPSFYIFHKSRCGSTLVCNMLNEYNDVIVIKEPSIINSCLQLLVNEKIVFQVIQKVVTDFCSQLKKHFKIIGFKLTSYCLQYIDQFKIFYPNSRTIYITRDTLQVLKSNILKPSEFTRKNNKGVTKRFYESNPNEHCLSYIFSMDEWGNQCNHIIEYENIIKPDFPDKLITLFKLQSDPIVLKRMLIVQSSYSKLDILPGTKLQNNMNNLGIELYDDCLQNKCKYICTLIDSLSKEMEISIKKCKSFSLFDNEFWKTYPIKSENQQKINKEHEDIFNLIRNLIYEKLSHYIKKYPEFYKSICMIKTNDPNVDIRNNTDIISINFTKYDVKIHDCSLWHSEDSFVSLHEATRKIAFIFYLNDVNIGGETEFYFQNIKLKPTENRLVLFPTNWMCTHRGNTPLSNPKYILTGWVHSKVAINNTIYPYYCLDYKK